MSHSIKVIRPKPGVNRDTTSLESPYYGDSQWVRFYGEEGLPLKMGGYKLIDPGTTEIIRTLDLIEKQGSVDIYYGRPSSLRVTNYTLTGISGSTFDRTPLGFVANENNNWSFDQTTVLDANGSYISYTIAVAAPNVNDINNSIPGTVFWGPVDDTNRLVPLLSNVGTATLNNGTQVFVAMDTITADSKVITTINTPNNATPGFPYVSDTMILPGIGFFINSTGGTNDNSVVNYEVLEEETNVVGTATLVAGTVTVANTTIRNDSLILVSYNTPDVGNTSNLYVTNLVPGASFTITSDNVADTSTVNYQVIPFPDIFEGTNTLIPTVGGSEVTINIGGIPGLTIFDTSLLLVSHASTGGTLGKLYVSTADIEAGVSFKIKSTSATDSSEVAWKIYNYPNTAGGVVSVGGGTFLFLYGNNGLVQWSSRGRPNVFPVANQSIVASNKIIQGLSIRSGGIPGVLFWSLDTLVRGVYNASDPSGEGFTFDTIEDNISVLSPDSVVKYQSQFFWVGTDQFYQFDGVVQKIENDMATNFFFNNINRAASGKVFGIVNPKYSEISWYWPFFPSTENTHQITYNYKLKTWFTNEIGRSTGFPATSTFKYPILADNQTMPLLTVAPPPGFPPAQVYGLWMHEFGWDKIQNNDVYSIPAYFESDSFAIFEDNPNDDRNFRIRRLEPDFKDLVGNMTVKVNKRQFANDTVQESDTFTFNALTNKIDMDEQAGIISLTFLSNSVGGTFYMGKTLVEYMPGDPRVQD